MLSPPAPSTSTSGQPDSSLAKQLKITEMGMIHAKLNFTKSLTSWHFDLCRETLLSWLEVPSFCSWFAFPSPPNCNLLVPRSSAPGSKSILLWPPKKAHTAGRLAFAIPTQSQAKWENLSAFTRSASASMAAQISSAEIPASLKVFTISAA